MRRKRHLRPVVASGLILAALAALGAGGYALVRGVDDWREQSIEQRIDRYAATIDQCAVEQHLPVPLIRSVIRAESSGIPEAVSATAAKGLMQIRPDAEQDALARLKISTKSSRGDLFNGDYNIRIGTAYLRLLLDRFDGDLYLALAAYNWGPGNVRQVCQDHPNLTGRQIVEGGQFVPKVTRQYCQQIIQGRWEKLGRGQ